jgi:hypothetical protein
MAHAAQLLTAQPRVQCRSGGGGIGPDRPFDRQPKRRLDRGAEPRHAATDERVDAFPERILAQRLSHVARCEMHDASHD